MEPKEFEEILVRARNGLLNSPVSGGGSYEHEVLLCALEQFLWTYFPRDYERLEWADRFELRMMPKKVQ